MSRPKIAVFPGSFDPITRGHESIVKRAVPLFDEIVVAIGVNSSKKSFFTQEERIRFIEATFADQPTVRVEQFQGLTIDFCKSIGADYLLRGLRSTVDFNYEYTIAQMNRSLERSIETIFLMTDPELSAINSTVVRDIIRNGGDARQFLPNAVELQ